MLKCSRAPGPPQDVSQCRVGEGTIAATVKRADTVKVKSGIAKPVRGSFRRTAVSRSVVAERQATVLVLRSVVEMLRSVVGPNVEIVLHDLTQPQRSVVAIANGHVTGRAIGSSILDGPRDDKAFAHAIAQLAPGEPSSSTVVSGYPTLTPAGQPLKSDTVIFRDRAGLPFAALCINSDMTVFEAAASWLESVLHGGRRETPARAHRQPEVDVLMQEILEEAVRTIGKPARTLSRAEKVTAVERMMRRGVFSVRGSIEKVATALGVTRFTIYNYLDEIRGREKDSPA